MLTNSLELKQQPVAAEPWTKKTLLAIQTTTQILAKNFNALEAILFFMVVVSGIGELTNHKISVAWYGVLILVLGANFYLRFEKTLIKNKNDDRNDDRTDTE